MVRHVMSPARPVMIEPVLIGLPYPWCGTVLHRSGVEGSGIHLRSVERRLAAGLGRVQARRGPAPTQSSSESRLCIARPNSSPSEETSSFS